MSHFKVVCICGAVLSQCRCPGPKAVTVAKPCNHWPPPLPFPTYPGVPAPEGYR